jgi:hypothetical protein
MSCGAQLVLHLSRVAIKVAPRESKLDYVYAGKRPNFDRVLRPRAHTHMHAYTRKVFTSRNELLTDCHE